VPASVDAAPEMVRIVEVAPLIAVDPLYHCSVGVGEPDTATVNCAVPPTGIDFEVGCVVIVGAELAAAAMFTT